MIGRARQDLVILNEHGVEDVFLWEHTLRVATAALGIASASEIENLSPDNAAILAASLYHDAAWATRVSNGEQALIDVLVRPLDASHRETSVQMMVAGLNGIIPGETVKLAADAIRQLDTRNDATIEAQVVMEADNLEEFGLTSLWSFIRKGAAEGKGVQALIDNWERRKEYQFWSARLSDGFRFEFVRELAKRRLREFEDFIHTLNEQHRSLDVGRALDAMTESDSAGRIGELN